MVPLAASAGQLHPSVVMSNTRRPLSARAAGGRCLTGWPPSGATRTRRVVHFCGSMKKVRARPEYPGASTALPRAKKRRFDRALSISSLTCIPTPTRRRYARSLTRKHREVLARVLFPRFSSARRVGPTVVGRVGEDLSAQGRRGPRSRGRRWKHQRHGERMDRSFRRGSSPSAGKKPSPHRPRIRWTRTTSTCSRALQRLRRLNSPQNRMRARSSTRWQRTIGQGSPPKLWPGPGASGGDSC